MQKVLDAYAILAWLQDEPGASRMDSVLRLAAAGQATLFVSSINVGEVYYRLIKAGKAPIAEQFVSRLQTGGLPMRRVAATNPRVDAAANLKARHALSYADAFAVSLAIEEQAPLLTDDPEILHLSDLGIVQVERVRA